MSQSLPLLTETADRLFADLATAERSFAAQWPAVREAGFDSLLTPEASGGFGGDWQDAFAVLRLAGLHVLAAPLAEAMIAARAVAEAGWDAVDGLTTLAAVTEGRIEDGRFSGVLFGVPCGGDAAAIVAVVGERLVRLAPGQAQSVDRRFNPAGEARDWLRFDGAVVQTAPAEDDLYALGALARTAQIAGALDGALALSIQYANDRVQFGKPIGRFQAVQQALAVFAEEAAAVNCAGQAAGRAADRGEAGLEIAAAKLRANRAAGTGAAVAHQVHGAIGFTQEHALHPLSRRLVAWRSEYGGDRAWSARLGAEAAKLGADGLWPALTRRSDPS